MFVAPEVHTVNHIESDTLICEHPSCRVSGQLLTARLWPCGDSIEYVRCASHTLLDTVVATVGARRVSTRS